MSLVRANNLRSNRSPYLGCLAGVWIQNPQRFPQRTLSLPHVRCATLAALHCCDGEISFRYGLCAGNPALLPRPLLGLFCGRVVPGSSEVPSENSVIASLHRCARMWFLNPQRVPLWTRTQSACLKLGLLCSCVVPGSSKGPFEDTVTPRHSVSSPQHASALLAPARSAFKLCVRQLNGIVAVADLARAGGFSALGPPARHAQASNFPR